MPVSMNGPSTVAVYVDMACDDRFTAQRCIKRIIFQCRFAIVFIVMVLAMVMSIMVVPLLTSMEMRKVMAVTVPMPAVLPQVAPCGNGKPAAKGNEGEARDRVDDMAETLRECAPASHTTNAMSSVESTCPIPA